MSFFCFVLLRFLLVCFDYHFLFGGLREKMKQIMWIFREVKSIWEELGGRVIWSKCVVRKNIYQQFLVHRPCRNKQQVDLAHEHYPSIYLSVCLSAGLSVYLSVCLFIYLSSIIYLYIIHLCIYLSIYLSPVVSVERAFFFYCQLFY